MEIVLVPDLPKEIEEAVVNNNLVLFIACIPDNHNDDVGGKTD